MKKLLLLLMTTAMFSGLQAQTCEIVDFTMATESFGQEISWDLTDEFGNIVFTGEGYNSFEVTTTTTCLTDGCYGLNLYDSFGDGWHDGTLTATWSGQSQTYTIVQGEYMAFSLAVNTQDSCNTDVFLYGCTDPQATNYDPWATVDDGSCVYQSDTIYGCTDPQALNYNPFANVNDGSCEYSVVCDSGQVVADSYVCVFNDGQDVGFEIVDDAGTVIYSQMGYNNFAIDHFDLCLSPGVCYTANLSNLSGPYGWYNGYFWVNYNGVQLITGSLYDGEESASFQFSVDGTCGTVYGCMDSTAVNYNPQANVDDGSCVYPVSNDLCADALPLNNGTILIDNSSALLNEGIYGDCWNSGQGEGEQTSLWYTFTTPSTPTRITIETSGDGTYTLTDTQFGLFDQCGGQMIACDGNSGDGLYSMFDFACGELSPSTEYILVIDGYFGDAGTCYLTFNSTSECDDPVYGCTDSTAVNYNPLATIDDGSCTYLPDSCMTNQLSASFISGSWAYEVSFDITGPNGDVVLSSDGVDMENNSLYFFNGCADMDGCYTLNMYDSFGDGWNGGLLTVSVNGAAVFLNVTLESGDASSMDFGVNDTSCAGNTAVYGCTDPTAMNYDPSATVDDGSCFYDSTNYDCVAGFELIGIDQENDIVYLLNTSITGPNAAYYWDFGDGGFSYEELPQYQYSEGGTYMICLTVYDALNCVSTYCDTVTYEPGGIMQDGSSGFQGNSAGWWINVTDQSSVGISEFNEFNEFGLYPVPASEILYVNFESSSSADVTINITDLRGRVIRTQNYSPGIGTNLIEMEIQDLSEGTYLIEAFSHQARTVRKFEVMR